jgi:hypothetical protein
MDMFRVPIGIHPDARVDTFTLSFRAFRNPLSGIAILQMLLCTARQAIFTMRTNLARGKKSAGISPDLESVEVIPLSRSSLAGSPRFLQSPTWPF